MFIQYTISLISTVTAAFHLRDMDSSKIRATAQLRDLVIMRGGVFSK